MRLYPAAWICATITALAWLSIGLTTGLGRRYLHSISLWIFGPWVDGVYWSLAVEIEFYSLIFLLLVVGQFPRVTQLAWLLTLGCFGYLAYAYSSGIETFGHFLSYSSLFSVGIFVWSITSQQRSDVANWTGLTASVVASIVQITMQATSGPALLPALLWLACLAAIFASSRRSRLFASASAPMRRALRKIGLATYPLYLLHNVVGAVMIRLLVRAGMPPLAALAMAFSFVIALSLVAASLERSGRKALVFFLTPIKETAQPNSQDTSQGLPAPSP